MARPSRDLDKKMIAAGRKLVAKSGVSGVSIRQVAEEAGVNLGMFNYHFGSKEEFVRQVLQIQYEELFSLLEAEFLKTEKVSDPAHRVSALLEKLGSFVLENREFIAALARDLLTGEPLVLEFIKKNAPRHVLLIRETVVRAQKAGGFRKDVSPEAAVLMSAAIIGAPVVFGAAIEKISPKAIPAAARKLLFSEAFLKTRIAFLLRGLKS